MKKYTINSKYKLGQKIKIADRIFCVIGFEYIVQRGLRYALLHFDDGNSKWEYMYDFEIRLLEQ